LSRPFLSVVIPAYNEGARILAALETLVRYLDGQSYTWEVLVVDDGSTDRTAPLVSEWASRRHDVRIESVPHAGKGWAVRYGMLSTRGQYRFMCDADMAMPIQYLGVFLDNIAQGYDIVIGSRQIAGARRFDESALRHVMGRAFNGAVHLLAIGGFQDTQCGFKCFQGEAADALFSMQKTRGFGFDVEILYLAMKRGLSILELPIDWYHRKESKVRPGVDSLLMIRDVLRLRWRDLRNQYQVKNCNNTTMAAAVPLPYAKMNGRGQAIINTTLQTNGKCVIDGHVAIVVPTYNEANNLPRLTERIFALGIPNTKLIIVDDNSPDGTAEVVSQLESRFGDRLELIRRKQKQGLGTAYVMGFSRALEEGVDYVLQMDADLSHAPEYIPGLLEALEDADVVVGSRYTRGGRVDERWSVKRRILSSLANIGIRVTVGLKVKDSTTGFKAFRASVLRSMELTSFQCKGFGFQAEVAYTCQRKGYRVVEYPIVFYERKLGKSKMSLNIVLEALWRLILLRWRKTEVRA
jgi:glycosyltransferase involved in cell wall biosynthesis